MAKLVVNSESLVSVADAIREKGGTSESLTFPQGFVDAVGAIESGGTDEIENIIDKSGVLGTIDGTVTVTEKVEQLIDLAAIRGLVNECLTAHAGDLKCFFSKTSIADLSVFDFSTTGNFKELFKQCNSLRVAELDTRYGKEFARVFVKCTNLEMVILTSTSNGSDFDTAFGYCTKLRKISTLDLSSATNLIYIFYNCSALEEISFVAETIKQSISFVHSPKLTPESVQSIVDGLADLTGGTAQTLTLNADVKAKLTETQLATITGKNWNLA